MASLQTAAMQRAGPSITRCARPQQHRARAKGTKAAAQATNNTQQRGYDVVLSSGFLAFAAHSGFLQAVEEVGLPVRGVMGTSAGALVGSLWCAGYTPREIAEEFSRMTPIDRLAISSQPWEGGLLSLQPVVATLHQLIPAKFEDLQRDFGVGVVGLDGEHRLLDSGCLPEAVAASAAIPMVFSRVAVPGTTGGPFVDGGIRCRIGLDLWRQRRYGSAGSSSSSNGSSLAAPPAVVHLIKRSSPFSGNDSTANLAARNAMVVNSPKSGKSFWQFERDDFDRQFRASRDRALTALEAMLRADGQLRATSGSASSSTSSTGSWRRAAAPPGVGNAVARPALLAAKALPPAVSERSQ